MDVPVAAWDSDSVTIADQRTRGPGLTTRRHVDYGRVRSAICPAG